MAGFVRVMGSGRVGSVVARPLAGGWVWASRPLPVGGRAVGFSPAPACVFVPFDSLTNAAAVGRVLASYGVRVWVRPGAVGSQVFAACGLAVPAFVVKVAIPAGRRSAWLVSFVHSVLSAGVLVPAPVPVRACSVPLGSLAWAL